jgi:hypothetical protein
MQGPREHRDVGVGREAQAGRRRARKGLAFRLAKRGSLTTMLTIFVDRRLTYHSTVACADYPEPHEAWWAWPYYQKAL